MQDILLLLMMGLAVIGVPLAVVSGVWCIMRMTAGKPLNKTMRILDMVLDLATFIIGTFDTVAFLSLENVENQDWPAQLYNSELHFMIEKGSLATVAAIIFVSLAGYAYAKFVPLKKQPPLASVIAISAMYSGAVICVVWCIQTVRLGLTLCLPVDVILIYAKVIHNYIVQEDEIAALNPQSSGLGWLSRMLDDVTKWPVLAIILMIPLLAVLLVVLLIGGQRPDSVIRAWTQTADWTFSMKQGPENLYYDEHYLCTVAAGGHRKVVKPLRNGRRHGHEVLVNRQLCVANAFEQLLQEKTPRFQHALRSFYDKTGYPIARHIGSPFAADFVYIIMKPLEWMFLIVLYLFDTQPENRIAVQYPHAPLPEILT